MKGLKQCVWVAVGMLGGVLIAGCVKSSNTEPSESAGQSGAEPQQVEVYPGASENNHNNDPSVNGPSASPVEAQNVEVAPCVYGPPEFFGLPPEDTGNGDEGNEVPVADDDSQKEVEEDASGDIEQYKKLRDDAGMMTKYGVVALYGVLPPETLQK